MRARICDRLSLKTARIFSATGTATTCGRIRLSGETPPWRFRADVEVIYRIGSFRDIPSMCEHLPVEIHEAGAMNLAGFVSSTAGRVGVVEEISGGVAVAGPIAVPHGYVNAAVPTDPEVSVAGFIDEAINFFAGRNREFVLWAPQHNSSFSREAARRGLLPHGEPAPAMVAHAPLQLNTGLRVQFVEDAESARVFGDLCERGYEQPGMAWLMAHHQSYSAANSYWHIALDKGVPVSAACGYLTGDTGGVYSVATPVEFRGRGFGATVTAAAANHLFGVGAARVLLQSSKIGFGVYERLGFTVYDHYDRFLIPA